MEDMNIAVAEQEEINTEAERKWLTFWLDGQLYGASIAHVEQILSMMPITEVPEYPRDTKGIITIRGTIVPVIDLRLRLGKEETAYTDQTCLIVCRIEEAMVGFIADAVDAVVSIEPSRISAPPQMGEEDTGDYLVGIARLMNDADTEEKLVLCLDTAHVLLRMGETA